MLFGREPRRVLRLDLRRLLGLPAGGLDGLLARRFCCRPPHGFVVQAHGFLRVPPRASAAARCAAAAASRLADSLAASLASSAASLSERARSASSTGRGITRERGSGYPVSGWRRSSDRMIFPLALFGSSSTNATSRGYLYGAVTVFTCSCSSPIRSAVGSKPCLSTTNALTISPRSASGAPTTALSATAGCSSSALSTSNGPIRYADERITSSARPTNQR